MAWKNAWWTKIAGGNDAIKAMASFNTSAALRRATSLRRMMPVTRDSDLGVAAATAGVDPATGRRLDAAAAAMAAQKQKAIQDDAGIPDSMRDPRQSQGVQAFLSAQQAKRKKEEQESTGFGGWLTGLFAAPQVQNLGEAVATGDKAIVDAVANQTGATTYQNGEKPWLQGAADWASEAAKNTVETVNMVANAALSPIAAPHGAGSATESASTTIMKLMGSRTPSGLAKVATAVGAAAVNFGEGAADIVSGVDDQQKQDMRNAGYDPDSWSDRYGWYANVHNENSVQSERWNRALIAEGKNPYKVQLVREIVTSGVDDDPARYKGLSEDAQKMLGEIQGNRDPEASDIFKRLVANSTSLGANLADANGLKPEDGAYTAVAMVGDLAAYWFLDPAVAAGGAVKAYRNAKFAVEMDPSAIKEAVALGGTTLAKRWDDVLDRVDRIHVLSTSGKVEDQARAAREFTTFQQVHADVMPLYATLRGMREGSVTGTMFKAPAPNAKFASEADFRTQVLGIERVDDPAKFKPVFSLRDAPDGEIAEGAKDAARAAIAERISDAIMADAVLSGRPIVNGKVLMPGQLRVTTPVRIGLQRFTDKVLGQKGKLLQQLEDAKGGVIDFDRAVDSSGSAANLIDTAKGGEWIRENYTRGGLRDRLSMSLSRFAVTKDAPVIKFDDAANTQDIYNFTRFFMPRGQAAFIADRWAVANPATRSVMLHNMVDSLGAARLASDGKASTDFWRQSMKGRETPLLPGEPVREAYSRPSADLIETEAGPVAAAMYSTQFSEGVRLPSYVDVLKNTEKVGVFSMLAGISHSRWVNKFTQVSKAGQVGTTSNMLRQATEGRALQVLDDPLGAVHAWKARMGLAGSTAAERAAQNAAIREARKLVNSGKMDELTPLHARGKFDEYAAGAEQALGGMTPELKSLLTSGAELSQVAKGRSALRLATTRVAVDPLRRARAALYDRIGLTGAATDRFTYDWLGVVEDRLAERIADGVHNIVGGKAAHYMDGGLAEDMAQVQQGLENGQRLARIKLRNTQAYLGAAGDSGAQRWGNALGLRMADPVGKQVVQAVAVAARHELELAARINRASVKAKAKGITPERWDALEARIRSAGQAPPDPAELATRLLTESPEGEAYRLSGRRAQYLGGRYVGNTPDQKAALTAWGEQMAEDAAHYLGLRTTAVADGVVDPQHSALLAKLARGMPVDHDDLAKVADEFRPAEVHAPVIVGKKFLEGSGTLSDKIVDGASKRYEFGVAKPLARMVHEPQVVAAHHEVMAAMEPVARAMKAKGLEPKTIYDTLDSLAYGHAMNRVARYSDNPGVTSYFAALSNNWLWYERAMEDFARRAIRIVKADPAVVARAHLLFESAAHAGMVTKTQVTDDEGNAKTEYMFSWPGSGLALRTVNEAARALGIVDEDTVQIPVWQNLTSPVKWLSPSLQNPLGFTTTPLIGMPLRGVKAVFPETTLAMDSTLSTLEGGERFFGSQSLVESLLPVYGKRIFNLLDQDDRDSQMASATKNALIYMSAAGKLPPPDAPAIDRQRALDDLRTMVQNNLIFRGVVAGFLPATPGTMGSNVSGIGDADLNVFDRERGVNTIRGEWFTLLEDMSKRFPNDSNRAFSEAAIDWLKRDKGSILDPTAFTVGSSGGPGWETDKAFSSSTELTQWMLDNRGFLSDYGQAAYRLLPTLGGEYYSQVGYQVQLRQGLRQHKDSQEFYADLVTSQTNSTFFSAIDRRNEMLERAGNDKAARQKAYDWFNGFTDDLKRANPVWADQQNETRTQAYVGANIAPAVARMATDENVPVNVREHQPSLAVMADLWDQYQVAMAKHPSPLDSDVKARKNITKQYNQRGGELFKGGALDPLWKSMSVWED